MSDVLDAEVAAHQLELLPARTVLTTYGTAYGEPPVAECCEINITNVNEQSQTQTAENTSVNVNDNESEAESESESTAEAGGLTVDLDLGRLLGAL